MSNRIFYASHAVSVNGVTVPGAQSVSVNTNYNLEQIFQLGRLAIYDNIATDPEVEVTLNKVLDGHSLIWTLATGGGAIIDSANDRSNLVLGVGSDTADAIAANTTAITMTGCFVNSLNYTFPVDGNFTEEVTFVGSNKSVGGAALAPAETAPNTRVRRRQHFMQHDGTNTILPVEIRTKRLSQATISTSFNREKMFALGEFSPFHRYVNFPIEVTVSFDVIQDGNVGTTLAGTDFDEVHTSCDGLDNAKSTIKIGICDEGGATPVYQFNLGSGCSVQSVSYSGGDTGGGNVTETWTYITYNDLDIFDNNQL